jgi:crotonobetainyl-CoA:carnitine CoA-transferase CaiB-like acyl-CoA transferase
MENTLGGPLDGILVVDLSRALAGPHAAMMLADLGARVIKVESPDGGDDSRGWGPPFAGPAGDQVSTYFLSCNRNKESVTLNLKDPEGREFLTSLLRHADVLIENFRPGVLDRLGFPATRLRELNQRLIVLSISGFGHDGPEAHRAGYDQIAQGEAGLMSLTGEDASDPTKVGVPIGDLLAGMNGAFGVCAALHERARTGIGRIVRTSLLAGIVGVHAFQGTRWTVAGELPVAQGNHHPSISPYGLFSCADGIVQISLGSERLWQAFCAAFGIDAARPDIATNAARVEHREEVTRLVNDKFAPFTLDRLLPLLAEIGIPAGEVKTLDRVYAWEQVRSQGLLISVEHPVLGTISLPGPALRFDDNTHAGGRAEHTPPPSLGEHNEAVRRWLSERDMATGAPDL